MSPDTPPARRIHVVAGVLVGPDGRVLIAERPPGKHLAGGWEFPGGKLEAGEPRLAGLARELAEELGIELLEAHELLCHPIPYPDRIILLDTWRVTRWRGEPRGLEGQALKWVAPERLPAERILEGNRPIVAALLGQGFSASSK